MDVLVKFLKSLKYFEKNYKNVMYDKIVDNLLAH